MFSDLQEKDGSLIKVQRLPEEEWSLAHVKRPYREGWKASQAKLQHLQQKNGSLVKPRFSDFQMKYRTC